VLVTNLAAEMYGEIFSVKFHRRRLTKSQDSNRSELVRG
jgi:hypothetical protein